MKAYDAHHARNGRKEVAYELQPTRFIDSLRDFDALGVPNFLAFSFTTEIPLTEKYTGRYDEHWLSAQIGTRHALKHGHDSPFPVVSFREHDGARTVKDLQKGISCVFW